MAAETANRKSVSFSDGPTIMSADGIITTAEHQDKSTAEGHSAEPADKQVDEVTEMFKGLSKKKKSKKPKDPEAGGEGGESGEQPAAAEGAAEGEQPAADGFNPAAMKKKKKKPKKDSDFEAKLAEAGLAEDATTPVAVAAAPTPEAAAEAAAATKESMLADLAAGRGMWAHDATGPIAYPALLTRFFSLIHSHHPDLLATGSRSYKIPPPQCLREGNRRTIFANITDICKRMKRSDDHVMQFLFAELGTSGSVDGARRLVIKGRFQQKQIENVLRRYIVEYVTCKTCRSPDTELNKGENRLYFVTCNSCGSRRSVAAIKTGFRGQVGKRKRMG